MNKFFSTFFERDKNGTVPLRVMLVIGAIISAIIALLLQNISSFVFLFIIWTGGVILSRSMDAAGQQVEDEAAFVIARNNMGKPNELYHKDPATMTGTVTVTDVDPELRELLDGVITPEEVTKIEQEVSEYDPSFKMTRDNIMHYIFKGKQKM